MPTWKRVIVSGSNAQLATVTASIALQVGTNQYITTSPATTYLSGSFSGSFTGLMTGTASWSTNAITASVTSVTDTTSGAGPYYITFKDATTGHPIDRIDSTGLTYNATNNALTSSIFVGTNNGIGFVGTSSWANQANSASYVSGSIFTSTNQALSASYALTASFALNAGTVTSVASASVVAITDLSNSADTQYIVFVGATSGHPSQSIDQNLTYQPSTNLLTVAGNIALNGGSISTTATTFNLVTQSVNIINVGSNTSTVYIGGNLAVNGTTTFINTENILVKDKFILLNSGSATGDGGIIIQETADFSGSAFFWSDTVNRWSLATGVAANATTATPISYIVSVSGSNAGAPVGNPTYGNTDASRIGSMYVDTSLSNATDNNIWIWA